MDARYPIGRFQRPTHVTTTDRQRFIEEIGALPALLGQALVDMRAEEWETPYRVGGWTIRQVVHHIADSHINMFVRFRLALTEDVPTIKPYDEAAWALLPDVSVTPAGVSVALIGALHTRWVDLMRNVPEAAFSRSYFHPDQSRQITLDEGLAVYAWHGKHHVAHIKNARRIFGSTG